MALAELFSQFGEEGDHWGQNLAVICVLVGLPVLLRIVGLEPCQKFNSVARPSSEPAGRLCPAPPRGVGVVAIVIQTFQLPNHSSARSRDRNQPVGNWAVGSLLGVEAAVWVSGQRGAWISSSPDSADASRGRLLCRKATALRAGSDLRWYCATTPNQTAPSKWFSIAFAVSRRFLRPFITIIGANSLKIPLGIISSS